MTISQHSRKLLWGKSANRCTLCGCKLSIARKSGSDESIIGDECHIVSATPGGPRYDPDMPKDLVDDYSNLVLLCKVHHRLVDDQVSSFSVSRLKKLKRKHEETVSDRMDSAGSRTKREGIHRVRENVPEYLQRINTGKELLDIMTHAHGLYPVYDELRSGAEINLVVDFLQDAMDYGELGLESVGDTMRASNDLDNQIRELEQAGFWVFGFREYQISVGRDGSESDWPVAHVHVLRDSNPDIIHTEKYES